MAELWELRGAYWRLPIYVALGSDAALCINLPSIPLLTKQRLAIEATLDRSAVNRNEAGWWIEKSTLARIAVPSQEEPEDVVYWNPAENIHTEDIEFNSCMDGFFESLAKAGWTASPAAARIQWRVFCEHMLYWMVERGRTVDLLFTRLMPCPLRSNWKQILLNKHTINRKDNSRMPSVKSAFRTFIERHCQHEHCLAVDNLSRTPIWSIETVPSKLWFRTVLKLQERRRRNLGSVKAFWNKVAEEVREFASQARELYARYLYEVHFPYITLPLRPWYDLVGPAKRPEVGTLHKSPTPPLAPIGIRYGNSPKVHHGADNFFKPMARKNELVSSLPSFRQRDAYLRKYLRTGGRLPLFHPHEGTPNPSPVLGGGEPTEPLGGGGTDREPARLEGNECLTTK